MNNLPGIDSIPSPSAAAAIATPVLNSESAIRGIRPPSDPRFPALNIAGNPLPEDFGAIVVAYVGDECPDYYNKLTNRERFNFRPETERRHYLAQRLDYLIREMQRRPGSLHWKEVQEFQEIAQTDPEKMQELTGLLSALDLTRCDFTEETFDDLLRQCPNLRTLKLQCYSKLTDNMLRAVETLTHLQTLSLSGSTKITDIGLQSIGKLTNLQNLDLFGCDVTDAGLKKLISLTALQKLDLSACDITDIGLRELTALTALQTLNLSGCEDVTEAGLNELVSLRHLQKVYRWGCPKISDAGLERLKAQIYPRNIDFVDELPD